MAIDFPNNPTTGDTYTVNGKTWIWDGTVWAAYGVYPDPTILKTDTINGRVGINNDTPTVALDVTGSTAVSGDLTVDGNFTVSGTTTTINTTNLNVEDNIITLNYGVTGTPSLDAGIEVERGDLANTSITWDESAESWVVGGTAYVDTANGRVGIGTTSPSGVLDIEHPSAAIVYVDDTGGTKGADINSRVIFRAGGVDSGQVGFLNTGSGIMSLRNNDGPIYVQTDTADSILMRTSATTRMTIDSSGNVGIGTTSPNRNLHVQDASSGATAYNLTGGIDVESNNISGLNILSPNTGYGRIYFGAPSSNTAGAVEYIHNATVGSGYMKFRAGAADRMHILGNGRVGINTASPGYQLDVNGNLRSSSHIDITSGTNDQLRLTANTTTARPYLSLRNWNGSSYVRRGYLGYPDAGSSRATIRLVADNGNVQITANSGEVNATPKLSINSGPELSDPSSANDLRVTTAYGYIDIGPKNSTYCHIYTDRGSFYFNKQTQHAGGIFMRGTLDMNIEVIDMTHSSSHIDFGDVGAVRLQFGSAGDMRWNNTYNYIQLYQGSNQRMVWALDNGYSYAQRFYQPGGGSTYNWSDERLKSNVVDYSNGLSVIQQLRPVQFTWDCDQIDANGETEIGLIAQEVELVYPKWVGRYNDEPHTRTSDGAEVTDVKALGFGNDFNVMVISAIQELAARVEALETP